MGHGYVIPRPDGCRARCGGPAICQGCKAEAAALELYEKREEIGGQEMNDAQVEQDPEVGRATWVQLVSDIIAGHFAGHA